MDVIIALAASIVLSFMDAYQMSHHSNYFPCAALFPMFAKRSVNYRPALLAGIGRYLLCQSGSSR